jgi:hypothetical protein
MDCRVKPGDGGRRIGWAKSPAMTVMDIRAILKFEA